MKIKHLYFYHIDVPGKVIIENHIYLAISWTTLQSCFSIYDDFSPKLWGYIIQNVLNIYHKCYIYIYIYIPCLTSLVVKTWLPNWASFRIALPSLYQQQKNKTYFIIYLYFVFYFFCIQWMFLFVKVLTRKTQYRIAYK